MNESKEIWTICESESHLPKEKNTTSANTDKFGFAIIVCRKHAMEKLWKIIFVLVFIPLSCAIKRFRFVGMCFMSVSFPSQRTKV